MSDLKQLEQKYKDGGKAEKIRNLKKDLEAPQASIGPIPRGKAAEFLGTKVAGAARSVRDALSAEVPVLGGTVGDWVVGETPEALEDWSYGFGPLRFGRTDVAGRAGALYGMKADPRLLDVVGAVEIPYIAGSVATGLGRKGMKAAAEKLGSVMEGRSARQPELEELKQKYAGGGRVGRAIEAGQRFFSAVDKAIDTLKQKKGTGEQILKQLEATPGVKQEELETRGIKQALQAAPKITQEELKTIAKRNPPPVPKRIVKGAGVPKDYQPELPADYKKLLDEYGIEIVVNPEDRTTMGFLHTQSGEIADADMIKRMEPEELGFPMNRDGTVVKESFGEYKELLKAVTYADKKFKEDLAKTGTKFSRYSQPGGENYREVLLEMPENVDKSANLARNRLNELMAMDKSGLPPEQVAKLQQETDQLIEQLTSTPYKFTRSHWEEPNIFAHFRVSDRTGPNGEKILFVDEIQSDWHQKARDARKDFIKQEVRAASADINRRAVEELQEKTGSTAITPENEKILKQIKTRMTREMTEELNKTLPKDLGYMSPEDQQKVKELNLRYEKIRNEGLTPEETAEYFQPGHIVKGYGGYDKVLSFNAGENSPSYAKTYDRVYSRAISAGVPEDQAADFARRRAMQDSAYDWSVTVIEVDPKTGEPVRGAEPRTHATSPQGEILRDIEQNLDVYRNKLPDAPFKDTWHEQAVKQIFDMASEEGYDKVAFSPGIEQVKRYEQGLRQAVDEIRFGPAPDGNNMLTGIRNGNTVFSGRFDPAGVFIDGPAEGKSLNEVLGREVSTQIEDQLPTLGSPAISQTAVSTARPMPEMSADGLLAEYREELTPDQVSWLEEFSRTWEDQVDDTPAGEAFAEELANSYTMWRQNQTLGSRGPAPVAQMGIIKTGDLTIGGEGMKSFYDKRLPDYVKKYAGKEFDAQTGYMDVPLTAPGKRATPPTEDEIHQMMYEIGEEDSDEFMDRTMEISDRLARERLTRAGIMPSTDPDIQTRYEDQVWELMDELQGTAAQQALRELATERLNQQMSGEPGKTLRSFTVDVSPKMKEKIESEGQKLFAVPPVIGAMPAAEEVIPGLTGTAQQPQEEEPRQPEPQMPIQVSPDEPQGFSSGGRVGLTKKAAERFLRVLHGSTTKVTPEAGRNMDVTTDPEYAMKRARDKMLGTEGPPMLNQFDIPEGRLLRFEEEYSPEDVALMRRFFNKLPQGQAMRGEDIYDAAQGKDYVLEGITKAGGFAGYQRPAAGSGGKGDWFRVIEPTELKRGKKAGGLARAFSKFL